ncbi:MAG TPA: hypothetical protein VG733_05255 [Chthoniobacteraceae bacterium]|nr:hypothetical protein [Chthoniobacteraceae bacterium]
MLILKIIDAVFTVGLIAVLYWMWRHHRDLQRVILRNHAMPREASRGLVYGALVIFVVGALMVSLYWLL